MGTSPEPVPVETEGSWQNQEQLGSLNTHDNGTSTELEEWVGCEEEFSCGCAGVGAQHPLKRMDLEVKNTWVSIMASAPSRRVGNHDVKPGT